jgi:hypothetical protein
MMRRRGAPSAEFAPQLVMSCVRRLVMITIRKSLPVFLISMLAIGAGNAADQEKPAASADATFKSLDRDSDQRLSKTEAASDKMLKEHWAAVDADSDGYLTKGEYTAHMKQMESQKKEY